MKIGIVEVSLMYEGLPQSSSKYDPLALVLEHSKLESAILILYFFDWYSGDAVTVARIAKVISTMKTEE